ncbi:MAG: peptidase S41 [bacterium]|nr:peptidase S41 [bacterium]
MRRTLPVLVHLAILASLASLLIAQTTSPRKGAGETRLLRFPDLHGDRVAFTHAGDIWLAPAVGGTAVQLTTHPGVELFARFSPDGQWIAFTGQYDGDEQVYVVPAGGGVPRQLTYYPAPGPLPPRWGYDNQVYGWTPDGSAVLFRSFRDGWDLGDTQLFTVSLEGGLPEALPMPESGGGAFSPDGAKVVYSPVTRDFRHWKRYQGGWAQDLHIFDLTTHDSRNITADPRTDRDPMWIGEVIYFASDRDGKLNLYAYDTASRETEQLTHEQEWDVRWPSSDEESRIVFELNGGLRIFDVASGEVRSISIRVPSDGLASRPARTSVAGLIRDFGLAPEGKRAVFAARGDIFSVPIEHGPTRNLTRSPGAHDREPAWSPDGRRIAFASDRSGEEEIWVMAQDGRGEPEQLTGTEGASTGLHYDLSWSPDGRYLAYRNQQNRLFVLDVASTRSPPSGGTREVVEVADDGVPFGLGYEWSPDSRFLALTLAEDSGQRAIHIWSREDRTLHRVTDGIFGEDSPSWDPDGEYLFYVSRREFHPQLGQAEFNYAVNRATLVYAMALRKDVAHPFPTRSDEVEVEDGDQKADDDKAGKKEKKSGKGKKTKDEDDEEEEAKDKTEVGPIVIDFDGLADRVAQVPVAADNWLGLAAVKDSHLALVRGGAPYYGRQSDRTVELVFFSLEDRKETTITADLQGLTLSPDRGRMLIRQNGEFQLYEASPGGKDSAKKVSTASLVTDRVPAEEWAQIFDEVWRRFRDFFYAENMHGYDWPALREQYRPLLEHVGHRSDLNYVMSEMIAELSVSHAYVTGGDFEIPPRPNAGLLGARFELDEASGRYRIARVFAGHNEEDNYRSPLTEIGVDVAEGDYLLEINGEALTGDDNPFRLLRHAGPGPVELLVNKEPAASGARTVMVRPIADEDSLIYLAFTERGRRLVEEMTGGRVGYIHLPDMGSNGIREWVKWFYGQIRKQGLVIDVRSNGGGNVSPMIIQRLRRQVMGYDFERNLEIPNTVPATVFHGHLVCLLDEDTASDGDQFAWAFREAGLGPLVGKRSWGGVVGIYPGRTPLIDGGRTMVPEAGSAGADGEWVIEGHGVEPDYPVENDPAELLKGRDQQLEKAVELLLEKLEKDPRTMPDRPAGPIKTE